MPRAGSEVIGRAAELEQLERFLARAGARVFVLEGDAGVGKTTLWHAGTTAARALGFTVLECRAAGSEVQLSLVGLADLFDEVGEDTLLELPPPQRHALRVALLRENPRGPAPEPLAIGLAVVRVLRLLAVSRPVLVAIDDLQWLDASTAEVLAFAFRRLRDEPIGLLAARRSHSDADWDDVVDLTRTVPEGRQARLSVMPLDVSALHRLLRTRLGLELSRPLLLRIHEASGGNPFYALELGHAVEQLREIGAAERLPIPESLQALVGWRIRAVPRRVQDVLLAVALLHDPRYEIVRAATGCSQRSLQEAVAVEVLEADGERVSFTHPLLASAVYWQAPPERIRSMHRRLAKATHDPEARARHLALGASRRSATVASALEDAAARSKARGAPRAAGELLELSIRLTPSGRRADVRRRKLEAAEAHVSAGAPDRATSTLRDLVDELPPGDERAGVLVRLAALTVDLQASLELAEQAQREVLTDERVLSAANLALAAGWSLHGVDSALRHARLALEHADASGDRRLTVEVLSRLSLWELWSCRPTRGLLERALRLEKAGDRLRGYANPRFMLGLWSMYRGRLDEARTLFETLLDEATDQGDELAALTCSGRLVDVELRAGSWRRADSLVTTTYELGDQIGFSHHDGGFTAYWQALVAAHLGRIEQARSAAELGTALSGEASRENTRVMNLGVLGFLEISLGNETAALPYLQPLLDWLVHKGLALAPHPMAPYALEALVASGETASAKRLIGRFGAEAHGLQSPWVLAIADRCRGLQLAREGDLTPAIEALETALSRHDSTHGPFERARTLLLLGRTRRRARQKTAAKQSLETALGIFEHLGAVLWSQRARDELQRVGLRPASSHALTVTERRVAKLAASGLTNRQVAAELFVSPKTVEANLARVYRKLGIRSRAELGARLGRVGSRAAQE